MRIDRALVYLRFARTRSRARMIIEEGHVRINGERARRVSDEVDRGDVLTLPVGDAIRVIELLELPERRGPAGFARAHYRELDREVKPK